MRRFIFSFAASACLAATIASAQILVFNPSVVRAACAQSYAACKQATDAALRQILSLSADENVRNTQIGALAAAVSQGIQSASSTDLEALAEVLKEIANASTDVRQAQSIAELADRLANGGPLPPDALDPVASSPT